MNKDELIKSQILLSVIRANQASSLIRAIKTSKEPVHPLFIHIENTQYFTIVADISKLFDRTGDSLATMIEAFRGQIKQAELNKIKQEFTDIRNKHQNVLGKLKKHRNKFASHIDGKYIYKAVTHSTGDMIEIDLGETENLIKDIIELLRICSFITDEEVTHLIKRIPPYDAQKVMGLEIDPKFMRGFPIG